VQQKWIIFQVKNYYGRQISLSTVLIFLYFRD